MGIRVWGLIWIGCLLLAAVAGSSALGGSGVSHRADRKEITGVLEAQKAAWNKGDVESFLQGYWHSPELTFAGSNGVTRGWDAVLVRYRENYPNRDAMGKLDFSELEFRFLGPDGALVLGRWHLDRSNGGVGGVFSLVWQKFPEGWRIVHDHTSLVREGQEP